MRTALLRGSYAPNPLQDSPPTLDNAQRTIAVLYGDVSAQAEREWAHHWLKALASAPCAGDVALGLLTASNPPVVQILCAAEILTDVAPALTAECRALTKERLIALLLLNPPSPIGPSLARAWAAQFAAEGSLQGSHVIASWPPRSALNVISALAVCPRQMRAPIDSLVLHLATPEALKLGSPLCGLAWTILAEWQPQVPPDELVALVDGALSMLSRPDSEDVKHAIGLFLVSYLPLAPQHIILLAIQRLLSTADPSNVLCELLAVSVVVSTLATEPQVVNACARSLLALTSLPASSESFQSTLLAWHELASLTSTPWLTELIGVLHERVAASTDEDDTEGACDVVRRVSECSAAQVQAQLVGIVKSALNHPPALMAALLLLHASLECSTTREAVPVVALFPSLPPIHSVTLLALKLLGALGYSLADQTPSLQAAVQFLLSASTHANTASAASLALKALASESPRALVPFLPELSRAALEAVRAMQSTTAPALVTAYVSVLHASGSTEANCPAQFIQPLIERVHSTGIGNPEATYMCVAVITAAYTLPVDASASPALSSFVVYLTQLWPFLSDALHRFKGDEDVLTGLLRSLRALIRVCALSPGALDRFSADMATALLAVFPDSLHEDIIATVSLLLTEVPTDAVVRVIAAIAQRARQQSDFGQRPRLVKALCDTLTTALQKAPNEHAVSMAECIVNLTPLLPSFRERRAHRAAVRSLECLAAAAQHYARVGQLMQQALPQMLPLVLEYLAKGPRSQLECTCQLFVALRALIAPTSQTTALRACAQSVSLGGVPQLLDALTGAKTADDLLCRLITWRTGQSCC